MEFKGIGFSQKYWYRRNYKENNHTNHWFFFSFSWILVRFGMTNSKMTFKLNVWLETRLWHTLEYNGPIQHYVALQNLLSCSVLCKIPEKYKAHKDSNIRIYIRIYWMKYNRITLFRIIYKPIYLANVRCRLICLL